jgi:hypothetical protein
MPRFVPVRVVIFTVLLFSGTKEIDAQSTSRKESVKFLGRDVTIIQPELDADDFPKGPDPRATVCLEGLPRRQCYSSPQEFWKNPAVSLVQVQRDLPALLFSVETWGASGWQIRFALLRPGPGKDLEDLFRAGISVSNQSQHLFWTDSSISDAQIFVTADYVWGPDEAHYSKHRYIISAYVRKPSSYADGLFYYLEDRYMTVHRYDPVANTDILASEKQEILARLRRVKAETKLEQQESH